MLKFVKFDGDDEKLPGFLEEYANSLSPESQLMLGAFLPNDELPLIDDFDFTFTQMSQVTKADPFSGASIKLKFDLDDLNVPPEQLEQTLIDLQEQGNFQGMMVELGNGDVFLKIGYRDLPFADRGEGPGPGPDELVEQALTDLSLDLF